MLLLHVLVVLQLEENILGFTKERTAQKMAVPSQNTLLTPSLSMLC